MREELPVKSLPSQPHCCISDAKMDAPLRRAWFSMKAIVTFCKREVTVFQGSLHTQSLVSMHSLNELD